MLNEPDQRFSDLRGLAYAAAQCFCATCVYFSKRNPELVARAALLQSDPAFARYVAEQDRSWADQTGQHEDDRPNIFEDVQNYRALGQRLDQFVADQLNTTDQ